MAVAKERADVAEVTVVLRARLRLDGDGNVISREAVVSATPPMLSRAMTEAEVARARAAEGDHIHEWTEGGVAILHPSEAPNGRQLSRTAHNAGQELARKLREVASDD